MKANVGRICKSLRADGISSFGPFPPGTVLEGITILATDVDDSLGYVTYTFGTSPEPIVTATDIATRPLLGDLIAVPVNVSAYIPLGIELQHKYIGCSTAFVFVTTPTGSYSTVILHLSSKESK